LVAAGCILLALAAFACFVGALVMNAGRRPREGWGTAALESGLGGTEAM